MSDWRRAVRSAANYPKRSSETVHILAFMKMNCPGYGWDVIGDTRTALYEHERRRQLVLNNVDDRAVVQIHPVFQLMYGALLNANKERTQWRSQWR